MMITASVGLRRPNRATDVRSVQMLLNRARASTPPLKVDGLCGPLTSGAITGYQGRVMRFGRPDGVVDPHGPTLRMLSRARTGNTTPSRPVPRPSAPAPAPAPTRAVPPAPRAGRGAGSGPGGISEQTYMGVAARLECEMAAVKAVVETEVAIRGPFDVQGRPTILFERHKFYKHTKGRFFKSDPDICNPDSGGYGRASEQHPKMDRAMKLDRAAALKSASWGAFQILGENHVQAGHATVEAFVDAMKSGIMAQVEAFIAFVRADRRLLNALRRRSWEEFARIYNGPSYKKYRYDQKMRTNYQRFANVG